MHLRFITFYINKKKVIPILLFKQLYVILLIIYISGIPLIIQCSFIQKLKKVSIKSN